MMPCTISEWSVETDSWRNIRITLIVSDFGEQTAQACAKAGLRQLFRICGHLLAQS